MQIATMQPTAKAIQPYGRPPLVVVDPSTIGGRIVAPGGEAGKAYDVVPLQWITLPIE